MDAPTSNGPPASLLSPPSAGLSSTQRAAHPPAAVTIACLPEELLVEIARHLVPPSQNPLDILLYGPGPHPDQRFSNNDDDDGWQEPILPARTARMKRAQALTAARQLGALRLVDRRWERAATSLLFRCGQLGTSERVAWLSARPRLAQATQQVTIFTSALRDVPSQETDRFGSGAVLQALVRDMSALRALAIQGPLPAAVTNSLSDPLTGRQLHIDTLERVSLVCAWSPLDDPSITRHGPAILRLPPILGFLKLHPHLQTVHISGCQLAPAQLGFALGTLADAGIRLRILSIEVSSRLAQGFEDVVVNRLQCLVECARTMGTSLECIRLFGEHTELRAAALHGDVMTLVPGLAALTSLCRLNLGLVALDAASPLLATLVRTELLPVCRALLPSQVYWTEEKVGHISLVNPFSHRLGRTWVSAATLAAQA